MIIRVQRWADITISTMVYYNWEYNIRIQICLKEGNIQSLVSINLQPPHMNANTYAIKNV